MCFLSNHGIVSCFSLFGQALLMMHDCSSDKGEVQTGNLYFRCCVWIIKFTLGTP
jgi:hypothetical protein